MNKGELIEKLSGHLGDQKTSSKAVDALVSEIENAVSHGEKVNISGFGVFEKRERAARTGRNPRTGEPIHVKKTTVPAFRAGSAFKERVAGQGNGGGNGQSSAKSQSSSAKGQSSYAKGQSSYAKGQSGSAKGQQGSHGKGQSSYARSETAYAQPTQTRTHRVAAKQSQPATGGQAPRAQSGAQASRGQAQQVRSGRGQPQRAQSRSQSPRAQSRGQSPRAQAGRGQSGRARAR